MKSAPGAQRAVTTSMRKRMNRPWFFQLAVVVLCVMSGLNAISSFTQESASKKTQKAVQRGMDARAVASQPNENTAPKVRL
jgi:hypothetical protein